MLRIGPNLYDRPGDPAWWVEVNGELVASLSRHHDGGYRVALNLHYARHDRWQPRYPGKRVTRLRLDTFDTDRLERWAKANEARLVRDCPPRPPPPAPPDISPEAFDLSAPD